MAPSATRRQNTILCGILLVALIMRLGWGLSRSASDEALSALPDQVEYLTIARNVLCGHGFSFIDLRFNDRVYAFRMPGYPLFLAACGGNVRIVRVVQAILDTSTLFAIFLIARRLMPGRINAAVVAIAIIAVNPMLIYVSGLILSETLFVSMLTWGMLLLLTGFRRKRAIIWLAGGLLLALAVLVRPSAGGLPALIAIGAMLVNRREGAAYHSSPVSSVIGRGLFAVGITMLLLVGLVLMPWAIRNYRVLHHVVWTDTNCGITLYDGYNAGATGASDQRFARDMPQLQQMNELERSHYLSIRAIDFMKNNPRRVAELVLAKAARTWSPMPLSDQFGNRRYQLIALLYTVPFDLLILWGLFFGNLNRSGKVFLMLPAIYLTLVHALTIGSLRYRLPAEPPLAVLAACGLGGRMQRSKNDHGE